MTTHRVHGGPSLKLLPQPGASPGHFQQPAPSGVHTPLSTQSICKSADVLTPKVGVREYFPGRHALTEAVVIDSYPYRAQKSHNVLGAALMQLPLTSSLTSKLFPSVQLVHVLWLSHGDRAAVAPHSEQRCLLCKNFTDVQRCADDSEGTFIRHCKAAPH